MIYALYAYMYLTLLIYIDDFVHFTSVDDTVLDDFVLLTQI